MKTMQTIPNKMLISDMSNRWLSIRVEFLGNFIVFFAAVFAFYLRHTLIYLDHISGTLPSHTSI